MRRTCVIKAKRERLLEDIKQWDGHKGGPARGTTRVQDEEEQLEQYLSQLLSCHLR
jgi:hypothetical protein